MTAEPTDADQRPLSALLAQTLVAFTVELDDELELRLAEAGHPDAHLSLVLWLNLIRLLPESGLAIGALTAAACLPANGVRNMLACLERWRVIDFAPTLLSASRPARTDARIPPRRREGFGSGRGMRDDWVVHLTSRGRLAAGLWPPLIAAVEQRWGGRFGAGTIARLRTSLLAVSSAQVVPLPQGLPILGLAGEDVDLPQRNRGDSRHPPQAPVASGTRPHSAARPSGQDLPVLLSQVLLVFAGEFNRSAPAPLTLCANALRAIGEGTVRAGDLARLTGGSPETAGIGWQLKPYLVIADAPAPPRGKVVRLSRRGLQAFRTYSELVRSIERDWQVRFGRETILALRASLEELFRPGQDGRPLMAAGLVPPAGVARAGHQGPALGRQDVGAAARRRRRDLMVQNAAFVADPAAHLPHYPLWDINRGYGP
jgi:hypothetical protein